MRLRFILLIAALALAPLQAFAQDGWDGDAVARLQAEMSRGTTTSRQLVEQFLARIDALDAHGPNINSIIEVNPDALKIAAELDAERARSGPRSPMHGIPVLLKDNIDTADRMLTTAGSLALVNSRPAQDAFLVTKLRAAGAVILGKTNLSEWANFRSTRSTSGWSGRGGLTRNPYALDRNACGSSSGSGAAIAANFAVVAVGTETDGSIVCPSSINGLVGIKPTVGLVSRSGVIPISASQDTAGPMARSVADAVALLNAMVGADPRDPASTVKARPTDVDYSQFLKADGLRGARIGVVRNLAGFDDRVDKLFDQAIEAMRAQGAVIVDKLEIKSGKELDDAELEVLHYEFKDGLNKYLATRIDAPHTLQELIAFNEKQAARELQHFGQEIFLASQGKGPLTDAKYIATAKLAKSLAGPQGIDALLKAHKLDALVAPTTGPAWTTDLVNGDHYTGGGASQSAAVAGYPHITVPMGFVKGLPVGVSFIGTAWTEPALIRFSYAYEQATKLRRPPDLPR
ncbi:MAG TPA: amidase [Steroidobacteraceae bacterium]|nr:amidase [Steroidobacteraceae bacterium]